MGPKNYLRIFYFGGGSGGPVAKITALKPDGTPQKTGDIMQDMANDLAYKAEQNKISNAGIAEHQKDAAQAILDAATNKQNKNRGRASTMLSGPGGSLTDSNNLGTAAKQLLGS